MQRLRTLLALVLLASLCGTLSADEWPQWRGPNRDGISKESGLLQQWPEGGPKLIWQIKDLGDGYSAPAVVGDRLYVMSSVGVAAEGSESVKALSVADGKEIWTTKVGSVGVNTRGNNYPGSRSTPSVDGDRVYALGSNGDLACLEAASGKIIWQKNLQADFGGKHGSWAYAESPLVDGDMVVCTPGGEKATLVALNKKSGEIVWTCPVPGGDDAGYASVVIAEGGGVKQYVQFLAKGVVGVEAKTGKFLWRYDKTGTGPANIATPVARDTFVYSAGGRTGGALLKLKATGAGASAEEVYMTPGLPSAIGGAVEVNGALFGTTGQALVSADFSTGQIKWQERSVGAGALLYADGRLYWHGETSGEVALVEANPEAFREAGRFTPPDMPISRAASSETKSGKAWTYMAIANGKLYVRDWNCLWCYDINAK